MTVKHINIPIFIPHLGCPFTCLFCNQRRISAGKQVDPEDVVSIIEEHLQTIKPEQTEVEIAFFGGSFTAIEPELQLGYLQAVQPYLHGGLVDSIRISTRPDCIDTGILRFLEAWGVKTIELGVQSFNDEVLKASARGYRSVDVFKACYLIRKQGIKLGLQLMIGLPADNHQRAVESAAQAVDMYPDMVRIYPTLVIAATQLEEMYKQRRYIPLSLDEAIKTTAAMFKMFQAYDIPVIRMGLQPGEELRETGTVVAGPFHPALGELVEQQVFKEQAAQAITSLFKLWGFNKDISLWVNPRDVSKLVGQKRRNINILQQMFEIVQPDIKQAECLPRDTVGVSDIQTSFPELLLTRKQFLEAVTIE